ncbi:MAG: OmpA family protein [Campylobacterales bacterium]|nr:OmpA family protein [Campylobacterales bacterium]
MHKKIAAGLMGFGLGWGVLSADVSEMIFYPEADFSEGIFHFNYQGERNKNYGFMFEKGFDAERIVYVRPAEHRVEKLKDGTVKVSFANTDRYSYLQRAFRDDFLVSDEKGIVKILLSGGDCKGSPECVTAENILTVNVPKGYSVRSFQGLDQDLRPLKNPLWQRKGNTFTLTALDVKGACIMMELERLAPGQKPLHAPLPAPAALSTEPKPEAVKPQSVKSAVQMPVAVASVPEGDAATPKAAKTAVPETEPVAQPSTPRAVVEKAAEKPAAVAAAVAPASPKPPVSGEPPAPYFRNFQLFENQAVVALSSKGKERLSEWAEQFKAQGYHSVVINGYTDSIPPKRLKHLYDTNEILSESRAKVVADYLASLGIDPSRIRVNGLGALDPVAPNDTEEGRSKNRRIEFVLSR